MNREEFYYLYMASKGYPKKAIINELEITESIFDILSKKNENRLKIILEEKKDAKDIGKRFLQLSTNMFKTVSPQQKGIIEPNRILPKSTVLDKTQFSFYDLINASFKYEDHILSSFGDRFPIHLYIMENKSDENKFYYYDTISEELSFLYNSREKALEIKKAFIHNEMILEADLVVFFVAQPDLSEWRYENKAYRFIFLEAGFLVQNFRNKFSLENFETGVFSNYMDEYLNSILELVEGKQFVITAAFAKGEKK